MPALVTEYEKIDFDEGMKRFDRLVRPGSDPLIVILKGHLLIEEQLQGIIMAAVRTHKFVKQARLTFSQSLLLARAIAGHFNTTVVWQAAEVLNGIRNKLVHVAEHSGYNKLVEPFMLLCDRDEKFKISRHFRDTVKDGCPAHLVANEALRLHVAQMWIILDVIHDVVGIIREHHPLP
jgi:hypothetical protein